MGEHPKGQTILILGILSLVCCGFWTGVPAIRERLVDADTGLVDSGLARWLGGLGLNPGGRASVSGDISPSSGSSEDLSGSLFESQAGKRNSTINGPQLRPGAMPMQRMPYFDRSRVHTRVRPARPALEAL